MMDAAIANFLDDLTENKRMIAHEIRSTVLKSMRREEIQEFMKSGRLTFSHSQRGNFAFISRNEHASFIKLGFFHGSSLHDPEKLLHGKGKRLRYMKIDSEQQVNKNRILYFVEQALSQPQKSIR